MPKAATIVLRGGKNADYYEISTKQISDFDAADPNSTGQVMEFRVGPALAPDPTTEAGAETFTVQTEDRGCYYGLLQRPDGSLFRMVLYQSVSYNKSASTVPVVTITIGTLK